MAQSARVSTGYGDKELISVRIGPRHRRV